MPADIDRRYAREHLPDHARLLANIVRWAAERRPFRSTVDGPGLIDCHLYEQPGRADPAPRQPDERGHLARAARRADSRGTVQGDDAAPAHRTNPGARLLVSGATPAVSVSGGTASFEIASILDHEVVVLE